MGAPMILREDWPERLNAYVDTIRAKVFDWGPFDCCSMPADGIQAMTDRDFMAHMRGYTSAAGAYQKLLAVYSGGIDVAIAAIAKDLAWIKVAPPFAHRGAVMLIGVDHCDDPRFGGALGLCVGRHVLALRDDRLAAIPRSCCVAAWNIQHATGG